MNTARLERYDYSYDYQRNYAQNPITQENPIIEGYFHKEDPVKEMAIRKINATLCGILGVLITLIFISYYFSMSYELTLNALNRQVTTLNEENAELQNKLDRLKSFNNVDDKMAQFSTLQKPEKVIEVPAVETAIAAAANDDTSTPFNWAVGY